MPFEKSFENKYEELPLSTRYRFAEMEIARAVFHLSPLFRSVSDARRFIIGNIFDNITPRYHRFAENEEKFFQAVSAHTNITPSTSMKIHYFIIHGHSYTKIRQITGASFNTIAKARYGLPEYPAYYPSWTEEMLRNWNEYSRSINVWNEPLSHWKEIN